MSTLTLLTSAQQNSIDYIISNLANETMVVIRQDYQLVDEDDNVKNAEDKDYWKRTYALALRVGEDLYLVSDESVKPWSKEALSKNSKFQPVISSTACRSLNAIEFDEIDFETEDLNVLQDNRIYTFEGSELPGASVIAPTGNQQVYIATAVAATPISETNEAAKFQINITPTTFNFSESKNIYDLKVQLPENTFGGFAFLPVVLRPGLVEFCMVGMLQKVGGIWKLITVSDGITITQSDVSSNFNLETLFNDMSTEMNSFLNSIGIGN